MFLAPQQALSEAPPAELVPAPAPSTPPPEAAAPAVAPPCTAARRVRLSLAPSIDPELARELTIDLTAELAGRDIVVCEAAAGGDAGALAEVAVSVTSDNEVSIEIADHLTNKDVARRLKLAKLPPDGRALAIALAIDELLRASWAELSWRRAEPEQATPAPEPAAAAEAPPATRAQPRPLALSLRGAFEGLGNDYRAFGALLGFDMGLFQHGWLALRVGPEFMLATSTPAGNVSGTALAAEGVLGVCTDLGVAQLHGCLGAGPNVGLLWLKPDAAEGFTPASSFLTVVGARAALELRRKFRSRFFAVAQLSLGAALAGAELNAGDQALLHLEGLSYGLSLGLGAQP